MSHSSVLACRLPHLPDGTAWARRCSDALLVEHEAGDGYVLADNTSTELLVYITQAGQFKLSLPGKTQWTGEWFDPRTGQRQPLLNATSGSASLTNSRGSTTFRPPMGVYDAAADMALRLNRVQRA